MGNDDNQRFTATDLIAYNALGTMISNVQKQKCDLKRRIENLEIATTNLEEKITNLVEKATNLERRLIEFAEKISKM